MTLTQILARVDASIAELQVLREALAAHAEGTAHHEGEAFLLAVPCVHPRGDAYNVKIDAIKAVRVLTHLGLKEAKEGVEGACPTTPFGLGYQTDLTLAELRALGCTVEIRA